MSCQPSLSKSRNAPPAPIVSGRYFLPKAPLLCLKRMPASAVISVNSIAPEGRGGVGLGDGDATAAAVSVAGAAGPAVGACLHPVKSTTAKTKINVNFL